MMSTNKYITWKQFIVTDVFELQYVHMVQLNVYIVFEILFGNLISYICMAIIDTKPGVCVC